MSCFQLYIFLYSRYKKEIHYRPFTLTPLVIHNITYEIFDRSVEGIILHYCFRKVLTPSFTPIYSVNQWCMGIVSLKSNNVICKEENLKYGKETVLYNKSCKTFAKRYTVQIQCNVVVSENRSTAVLKKLNF